MPSPTARYRWLRAKLHSIRNGTGAAILPPNVSKLSLVFNYKDSSKDNITGHMGARKFFRECLPRLQYHNPTVDMSVLRRKTPELPATLTIHIQDLAAATAAKSKKQKSDIPETTVEINMHNRLTADIMDELIEKTSATLYSEPPRSAELDEEAAYLAQKRENKLAEKYKLQRAGRKHKKEELQAQSEIMAGAAI
ncbi:hypothetical protein TWF694_001905 [Orbilia ellipsospora]|uniref:Ribosomal protein/NADH dehydrogenase domain-containing protein n=1 Tax=Orbilia ellipsospora TaxID=2528407 RepID=A0AAV9X490_9PEZI